MKILVSIHTKESPNGDYKEVENIPDTVNTYSMLAEKGIILRVGDIFDFAASDQNDEDSLEVKIVSFTPTKGLGQKYESYDAIISYFIY